MSETTHLVNLDALIRREDFEADAVASLGNEPLFKVEELKRDKLYYSVLRKPEFQRETASWKPEMIVDFIESFLDDKLIPSIIIWHSKNTNNVFIVDGAHRVSALIAWVNDDYGDGEISRKFYGHQIPDKQRKLHVATRKLVEERIGSYLSLLDLGLNASATTDPVKLRRARAITTRQPHIQKVDGDALVAEESFFKINGNPATIDQTELDTIRARKKPNVIATRALMRAGSGHKHWQHLSKNSDAIEETAKYVHGLVFGPFSDIESKSPDVPRAGQPYSGEAFKMVLDMVNIFNDITPASWQKMPRSKKSAQTALMPDDVDGSETLRFLEQLKSIGQLVQCNEYSGSLGLDQAVYSYGSTGKIVHAAFLASFKFAVELRNNDKLHEFTRIRDLFEGFLVRHKSFLNEIGGVKGGRLRGLESIMTLHRTVMDCLSNGIADDDEIVSALRQKPTLEKVMNAAHQDFEIVEDTLSSPKKFSRNVQAIAIIREVLVTRARCPICNARLPPHARSKDHIKRLEDGGGNDADNLQFTHPFCQSGYKERLEHAERKAKAN